MYCKSVFLGLSLLSCSIALGQDGDRIKKRCEAVIVASINDSTALEPPSSYSAISRARLVPLEATQQFLLTCLENQDPNIRFLAANVLAEKSPADFDKPIRTMLSNLESKEEADLVQKTIILATLNDESARNQLVQWAKQIENRAELKVPGADSEEWVCPMLCSHPTHKAGRCPVCEMELVPQRSIRPFDDWQLKLVVLRALKSLGSKTAIQARAIVASDADSFSRLQAAHLWAQEEPADALPHLKLFLHSANRDYAIYLLADCAPKQSIAEFEVALKNPSNSFVKFEAWRGLLRAGKNAPLKDIRGLVDGETTTENDEAEKGQAIYLLGEFGVEEDVVRLEKLLDTEFDVFAAEALLGRFSFENHDSK